MKKLILIAILLTGFTVLKIGSFCIDSSGKSGISIGVFCAN